MKDFKDVARLIQKIAGIQLGEKEHQMVETRIKRRMIALGVETPEAYLLFFEKNRTSETQALVSILTTHHTYFFRESLHFEFLEMNGLKRLVIQARNRGDRLIRVWSAACSRGQEVYTLAMVLDRYLRKSAPDVRFEILGTDIDPQSIEVARNGVYEFKEIREIPLDYLEGNWARGREDISGFVRAGKNLKKHCRFQVQNLLDLKRGSNSPSAPKFDLIFCRNVFIYFTETQIQSITENLLRSLNPDGYLLLGLSESLMGQNLPCSKVGPSIYQMSPSSSIAKGVQPAPDKVAPALPTATNLQKLRVLIVDDSPTVLRILTESLQKVPGFEVVGTALNGIEAEKKVKELHPDVMTLDLHMPEMDGITYLQKNMSPAHPPTIIISSVSRTESELALRALQLGARDYVEKPTLNDLAQRGEEIRTKLRSAWRAANLGSSLSIKPSLSLDSAFSRSSSKRLTDVQMEGKLRIIHGALSDRVRIRQWLGSLGRDQIATVVLLESAGNISNAICSEFSFGTGLDILPTEDASEILHPRDLRLGEWQKCFKNLMRNPAYSRISILVFGELSRNVTDELTSLHSRIHVAVEDIPGSRALGGTTERIPMTSFLYHSDRHLFGPGDSLTHSEQDLSFQSAAGGRK